MVSLAELRQAASGEGSRTLADLIPSLDFPHVHPDHPLDLALERMGATKLDVLPVVSRADTHQLLGIVTLADILKAFGLNQQAEPSV